MTQQESNPTLSKEEIAAFAAKLEQWGQTLSPKERSFLLEILARAAGDDSVEGYGQGFHPPAADAFKKFVHDAPDALALVSEVTVPKLRILAGWPTDPCG
jgi:hypothetical protein